MYKMKWTVLFSSLPFLCIFLFQPFCTFAASSPVAASTSGPKATAEAVNAWNAVVSKAKEEGKLVISATSYTPATRQAIAKRFKDAFGIEIEYIVGGRSDESANKLLAERRAGLYLQDIFISGAFTGPITLKPAGAFDPLEPALMQPEVLDKKLWVGGKLAWQDDDRKGIMIMLMPMSSSCIINTALVKPDEIRVYDDFLNPKWKDKIVLDDPTVGGPGINFISAAVTVKGWDYVKKLATQKPVIIRDKRLEVEWVAKGKYSISLGVAGDQTMAFIKAGAPIMEIVPKDDVAAVAGGNNLFLINRAPHPNAAKVFINWILGKEGQTILTKAVNMASVKIDVATDHLPPTRRFDPAKKYFLLGHEDFVLKYNEYTAKAKEVFGELLQ